MNTGTSSDKKSSSKSSSESSKETTTAEEVVFLATASSAASSSEANSAVRNSTTTTTSKESNDPSCRSCVELLREILNRSESRPRSLLQSLFSNSNNTSSSASASTNNDFLEWRDTEKGVQVLIPTEASRRPVVPPHRRRWSRFHHTQEGQQEVLEVDNRVDDNTARNANAAGGLILQATSAADATNDIAPVVVLEKNNGQPETEWLQVSCKKCSDTGPEAGARAYIMGPTPLSMVVCTNRLLLPNHTTTSSESSESSASKGNNKSNLFSFSSSATKTLNHNHNANNSNNNNNKTEQLREMEEILTHELVHVYDVRRLQLDLRDCENLAYSEVRAAREAECRRLHNNIAAAGSSAAGSSLWQQYDEHQQCVRQKALTATHNLFPSHGQQCLQRVFQTAMRDKRPFGSNSNNKTTTAAAIPVQVAQSPSSAAPASSSSLPSVHHHHPTTSER